MGRPCVLDEARSAGEADVGPSASVGLGDGCLDRRERPDVGRELHDERGVDLGLGQVGGRRGRRLRHGGRDGLRRDGGRGGLGGDRGGRLLVRGRRGRLLHVHGGGRGLRGLVAAVAVVVVRRGAGVAAEDDDADDHGEGADERDDGSLLGHVRCSLSRVWWNPAGLLELYNISIKVIKSQ